MFLDDFLKLELRSAKHVLRRTVTRLRSLAATRDLDGATRFASWACAHGRQSYPCNQSRHFHTMDFQSNDGTDVRV